MDAFELELTHSGLYHGISQWPCLHYITALDLTHAVIAQGPPHIFSLCGCTS